MKTIPRRNILKVLFFLPITKLLSKSLPFFRISMQGELDDDIIIFNKFYNNDKLLEIVCYQMHNFSKKFRIGGNTLKSLQIPGYVKLKKDIQIDKNAITCIFTANEREDINNSKQLSFRTHYKSTSLFINDIEFFPSLIPENDDVKDYPTWYMKEESFASNYFRLWENATVLNGFVTGILGEHSIKLFNNENKLMAKSKINVNSNKPQQIRFDSFNNIPITNQHIFTEINNYLFDETENEQRDAYIMENGIYSVLIENSLGTVLIHLPYPCPYINTYYITLGEHYEHI